MDNVSSATASPPGWHPDPHVPGHERWWSGAHWTDHVKPSVAQPAYTAPFQPTDPRDRHLVPHEPDLIQRPVDSVSIFQENPASFMAIGISIAYLLIAMYSGFILLGIIPASFAFNAFSQREKLSPLAVLAAGVAIAFSLTAWGIL